MSEQPTCPRCDGKGWMSPTDADRAIEANGGYSHHSQALGAASVVTPDPRSGILAPLRALVERPHLLGRIEPQPPSGIKYCVGGESWLAPWHRTPVRLVCEEWGHLGPMILDPTIQPNKAGFRVRHTEIPAPPGAHWFALIDGVYYWTLETVWEL